MKIIGITGGIGSGKSTTAKLFSQAYNIPIIDADVLSKKAASRDDVIADIKKTFGSLCVDEKNNVDRKILGDIVFNNDKQLKKLNALIHPVVMQEFNILCDLYRNSGEELVIYDVPLLIEENLQNTVDKIVLIYADKKTRIDRIIQRNHLTYDEAVARITAQMELDDKIPHSDIVIYNTGTIEDLESALKYLYKEVQ